MDILPRLRMFAKTASAAGLVDNTLTYRHITLQFDVQDMLAIIGVCSGLIFCIPLVVIFFPLPHTFFSGYLFLIICLLFFLFSPPIFYSFSLSHLLSCHCYATH
jgi:hypothetical protein